MGQKIKLSPATISQLFDAGTVPFNIGDQVVYIRPLSVGALVELLKRLKTLFDRALADDVDFQKVTSGDPREVAALIQFVVAEAPDVVAELAQIEEESVRALPLEIGVALLDKCIDVNMQRGDDIRRSFASLSASVKKFVGDGAADDKTPLKPRPKAKTAGNGAAVGDPTDPVNLNEFPKTPRATN